MFSNDKELNQKFRDLILTLEADDNEEFIQNITELYKVNFRKFQLVLFHSTPFEVALNNEALIDKTNRYKQFDILFMVETPDLNHTALLCENFIFFQYGTKQVILLSKHFEKSLITKKEFDDLEEYFFQKILSS